MKEKVVRIEWVDSCSDTGWKPRDFSKKDASVSKCESVGFILKRDKNQLTIFQSKSHSTGQVTELISIPRKCITEITELKG